MSEKNRILELPVEDFTKLQYKLCEIEDQLLGMGAEPEKNYSLTDLIALHKSENLSEQLSYLCQRIDSLNGKLRTLNKHIERCDELGGMEKEKRAFIQCLKKFKQRQETASAVKTVVMPQEMLDLVRWLAKTTMDWHRRRHNALSFEGEECRNYLAMHFPIIQGTMNQVNLEKIGEQNYDIKKVGKAVKWLLEEGA